MPNTEERETLGGGRRRRQQPVAASLALLIEAHALVLQHLVRCRSLSQLVDWGALPACSHTGRLSCTHARHPEPGGRACRCATCCSCTWMWSTPAATRSSSRSLSSASAWGSS